ncbi:hypothetical protein HOU04_gp080 [Synechococcus phage S-T4]|jgi:hypothetical protein|uniref:Uncharacterized protein n=1 Tax=Synechococcus phage S-T4 TaxID=2268578 RepID=A0A385EHR4_9CAUD|nr:hypothetical protein HOU04_gp080 [Synechococcus phage S-T4]AXQ70479.1 hypothetical protein [Synechococcus phage S-T4]
MPSSRLSKVDILPRIYKLKTALYDGKRHDKSGEWHNGYHEALNDILDMLDEFSS